MRYATPSLHLDGGQNKNSINRLHCGCQAKGLQCCLGCRGRRDPPGILAPPLPLHAKDHETQREAGGGEPWLHGGLVLIGHLPLDLVAAAGTNKVTSNQCPFLNQVNATTT